MPISRVETEWIKVAIVAIHFDWDVWLTTSTTSTTSLPEFASKINPTWRSTANNL
jgi:hypothetical protein